MPLITSVPAVAIGARWLVIGTLLIVADLLADAFGAAGQAHLSRSWRLTFNLVLWLALVPWVAATLVGYASGGVEIETPLVIPLLVILAIPLVHLLVSLVRTMRAGVVTAPA
ncbi:MAG: hypothetical protein ACRDHD_04470 [Candidatus Limnocylindria bacterium]